MKKILKTTFGKAIGNSRVSCFFDSRGRCELNITSDRAAGICNLNGKMGTV